MKKYTSLALLSFLFFTSAGSQDFGYKTFDVGAEYRYYPQGSLLNLQLAFNSKIHHSFLVRVGYNKASSKRTSTHDGEEGTGWGGSAGYRYYFSVVPRRFFIGLEVGYWNMTIHWSIPVTESDTKLNILQPALETGYTLLINEQFFITAYMAAATQVTINTKGEKVDYGQGFIPLPGISAGWRF